MVFALKVKSQSLPERCEVCHQRDLFDAERNYCDRCIKFIETGTSQTILLSTSITTRDFHFGWCEILLLSMAFSLIGFILFICIVLAFIG